MTWRQRANQAGWILVGQDAGGRPVTLPFTALHEHAIIVGATKTGKSEAMANWASQYAAWGGPLILFDAHGDLAVRLVRGLPAERVRDVVVIDPTLPGPGWGVNLLQEPHRLRADQGGSPQEAQAHMELVSQAGVDHVVALEDDKTGYAVGSRTQSQVANLLELVSGRRDATFLDAYRVASDPKARRAALEECTDPAVRTYFEEHFDKARPDFTDPARNKLEFFAKYPALDLFCRRDPCASLSTMLKENAILVFNLDQGRLPRNTVRNVASVLLRLTLMTLDWDPWPTTGRRVGIFCDEYGSYPTAAGANFLAEARKRGAFLVLGFQNLAQLPPEVRAGLGNAATWAAFRSSAEDARGLAYQMGFMEGARPIVEAFTKQQAHQMQLLTLEAGTPRVVTATTLPIPPAQRPDLGEMARQSMRRWGKSTAPTDRATLFGKGPDRKGVLLALHAAELSGLGPYGVDVCYRAMGGTDWSDSGGERILEALAAEGHAEQGKLTPAGSAAVRRLVDPGTHAGEGGLAHRQGVYDLYCYLQSRGPADVTAPRQVGRATRPDLLLRPHPGALGPLALERKPVWYQFESSNLTKVANIVANIQGANRAGAKAVVVVRAGAHAARLWRQLRERLAEEAVAADFEVLELGVAALPGRPSEAKAGGPHPSPPDPS
ncbi:MAG: type IV secretory system conjugative DNA transfer family protein [Thermoplasmatota archaeon]